MKRLKEFLKPDWKKIILTILLLFFVFLVLFSLTTSIYVLCTEEGFRLHPESCGYIKPALGIELDLSTIFFISILVSYLLSCLLVKIYDKVKKK